MAKENAHKKTKNGSARSTNICGFFFEKSASFFVSLSTYASKTAVLMFCEQTPDQF